MDIGAAALHAWVTGAPAPTAGPQAVAAATGMSCSQLHCCCSVLVGRRWEWGHQQLQGQHRYNGRPLSRSS